MSGKSTMIDAWERVLERRSDDIALIEAEQKRSYRFHELNHLAEVWIERLAGKRLARKSVIVHLPNSADWIALLIALRRVNAVVIPVDYSWPLQKVEEVTERFRAALIITSSGIRECDLPHRKWKEGCSLVKLTSGSTGVPKGIVFSDDELIADGYNIIETMGISGGDRNLCLHPLGHSYAIGNVVVPLLAFGISVVMGSSPFPRVIQEEAAAFGATVLPTVPPILEALCKAGVESLRPIRLVISAAAPLTPVLATTFFDKFGFYIHNFYGSSETGGITYDRTGKSGLSGEAIGTPLANVRLRISKHGHLLVQSMAISHYGKPTDRDNPAEEMLSDRASIALDGSITLQGRADRVEKIGGKRIDLAAMEDALAETFSTSHVAIFKAENAIQVVMENGKFEEQEVKCWLSRRLGRRYQLRLVSKVPLTSRGKKDYVALKARFSK
ncbi:class I adenylate-forming enzyme family protein [Rubellicoccus peritrichatus]|uniref:Class I adenylate-forming enzyme family protein n=1 Tax=Rubellicoccus peritrichatus TaxID=3080537 RepID=A0AAQ3QWW3_9BACT|nr:class I adenylate-forming enzyme family protein [Puniceicoccus sp. CR14]WOO42332.1 class I adenylate-forming enzyme family protein [Puniceicoccus sp. CR14]